MPANVDQEKCDGCGTCVEECPTTAIKMEDGKAAVNKEECIDCNVCQDNCPSGAVTVES